MTTTAVETVWVPRGHPVRNFVLACAVVTVAALAVGWAGVVRPRVSTTAGSGQANRETGAFTANLLLENDAPLQVDILGFTGDHVSIEGGFHSITLDGGEARETSVSGRVRCGGEPVIRMRVRTPVGAVRTVTVDDASYLLQTSETTCTPEGLSRPSPPSAAR
jgi:hypothetical protein